MIVYSVTVSVDPSFAGEFLRYMLEKHVPEVMGTGCFVERRAMTVLDPRHPDGWTTYCFLYHARDQAELDRYFADFAPALRQDVVDRFGEKFTASRAVMQEISDV